MTMTQHLPPADACPRLPTTGGSPPRRFTTRARRALDRAQAVAGSSGRTCADTEHLLLALLDLEDAFATAILSEWGVTRTAVETDLRRVERHPAGVSTATPVTQATTREVSDDAANIAAELGHHDVGTEHILLALYSHEGLARQILTELGADHEAVRARIVAVLNPG